MSKRANLLSILLALQLILVAVVLLTDRGVSGAEETVLLSFDADAVDEMRIGASEDGAAIALVKGDDGWRLPDDFPADADKAREVLSRLSDLRAGWPVATSAAAGKRFEVDPDQHQRHVVLLTEGRAVAELYLGTAPGYQRVHARRADADSIFSVALSNYQLPVKADDWLDKTLLQPRGSVSSISRVGAWTLARGAEGWEVEGAAVDQEAAGRLERRLTELRVSGVAAAPDPATEPAEVFEIVDSRGAYRLSFYSDESGNDYRLATDRRAGYFKLPAYLVDQLLLAKESLMPVQTTDEDSAPSVDS
jgi:hypothetical protein